MSELKPCPFCGGEMYIFENEYTKEKYFYCLTSTCLIYKNLFSLDDWTIKKWNTREVENKDKNSGC